MKRIITIALWLVLACGAGAMDKKTSQFPRAYAPSTNWQLLATEPGVTNRAIAIGDLPFVSPEKAQQEARTAMGDWRSSVRSTNFEGNGALLTNLPGELRPMESYLATDGPDYSYCIQRAVNKAMADYPRGPGQQPIVLPPGHFGIYHTITGSLAYGFVLRGSGKASTKLYSHVTNGPAFAFHGFEYSKIRDLTIQQQERTDYPMVYMRGSGGYNSQSSAIEDCIFLGNGICPGAIQVNDNAWSDGMGSELHFSGLYISGMKGRAMSLNGWNALGIQLENLNFAGCDGTSIYIDGASVKGFSLNFQNGWFNEHDVFVDNYSADPNIFFGCRSESAHGPDLGNSPAEVNNWTITPGTGAWLPETAYSISNVVLPQYSRDQGVAYVGVAWICTQAGTSGPVEPNWPKASGVITNDGSCQWESYDFDAISIARGTLQGGWVGFGLLHTGPGVTVRSVNFTRQDAIKQVNLWDSTPILENVTCGYGATNFMFFGTNSWLQTVRKFLGMGQQSQLWYGGYSPTGFRYETTGFGRNEYPPVDSSAGYLPWQYMCILGDRMGITVPMKSTPNTKGDPLYLAGGGGRGDGGSGEIVLQLQSTNSGGNAYAFPPFEDRYVFGYDKLGIGGGLSVGSLANGTKGIVGFNTNGDLMVYGAGGEDGPSFVKPDAGHATNLTSWSAFGVNIPANLSYAALRVSTNHPNAPAMRVEGDVQLFSPGQLRMQLSGDGDNYTYLTLKGAKGAVEYVDPTTGQMEWLWQAGGYGGFSLKAYNRTTGGINLALAQNGDCYLGNADELQGVGRIITRLGGGVSINPGAPGLTVSNKMEIVNGGIRVGALAFGTNGVLGFNEFGDLVPYGAGSNSGPAYVATDAGNATNLTSWQALGVNIPANLSIAALYVSTNHPNAPAMRVEGDVQLFSPGQLRMQLSGGGDNYTYLTLKGAKGAIEYVDPSTGQMEWMWMAGGYGGFSLKAFNRTTGGINLALAQNGDCYLGNADEVQGTARIITRLAGGVTITPGSQGLTVDGNMSGTGTVTTSTRFAVGAAVGLTTNIVVVSGGTTNQLQFTGGILTGVVPQ